MNVAICDDESQWIRMIEKHLVRFRSECSPLEWAVFRSAEELLNYVAVNGLTYDVLITDISMKKMSGIDLANKIRQEDEGIVIFFLTAYDEYIRQCFQCRPLNFWDKPIEYESFCKDMRKAIELTRRSHITFNFKMDDEYVRLEYKRILYFQTSGKKIIIHTKDKDYECYGSFKEYSDLWTEAGFVKLSRFYFANITYISTIKRQEIFLTDGNSLKVSPQRMALIKNTIFKRDFADEL